MAEAIGEFCRLRESAAVKFYYFHLMPYYHGPRRAVVVGDAVEPPLRPGRSATRSTTSTSTSSSTPERLGWDGLCVNEHHQNCYGTMPSPNVMAAMLVRRTTRRRSRSSATGCRCARTRCASPRRSRCSTWPRAAASSRDSSAASAPSTSRPALNPTHSRDRFYEAAELDPARLDRRGPVSVRRPVLSLSLREPVAAAAPEAAPTGVVPVAGLERDGRVGGPAPLPVPDGLHADQADRADLRRVSGGVRAERLPGQPLPAHRQRAGRRRRERRKGARAGAKKHVMWVFNTGLRMHPPFWRPPGYMTEASLRRMLANPPKLPSDLELRGGGPRGLPDLRQPGHRARQAAGVLRRAQGRHPLLGHDRPAATSGRSS